VIARLLDARASGTPVSTRAASARRGDRAGALEDHRRLSSDEDRPEAYQIVPKLARAPTSR
jgi:hypothetical protein